jgi:hypothetical protein
MLSPGSLRLLIDHYRTHSVTTATGHSIHDWKLLGGFPQALREYAALFTREADGESQ